MKSLLIEKTTIGNLHSEVIMLHDLGNKRSSYVYTSEHGFENWVFEQAKSFRENGYFIQNNTEIKIN